MRSKTCVSKIHSFLSLKHFKRLISATVTWNCGDEVLFDMCDCTVDADVGTGDFSFVLGILHVCAHAHVRSHVFPGMECFS